MFRIFFNGVLRQALASLKGYNLLWHIFAIGLTYFFVVSGFDWFYFSLTRTSLAQEIALPAAIIGFFVPIVLPVGLYILAEVHRKRSLEVMASLLAQAGAIAWVMSSLYKAFTGRMQPEFLTYTSTINISNDFNFGLLKHGIFWGWPSSHTAVAFAMSVAFFVAYPKMRVRRYLALIYAIYIGIGVSLSVHWFSDFVAGAIIGTTIGIAVAKSVTTSTRSAK